MTALAETNDIADVTYMATDPEGLILTYRLMGLYGAKFQLTSSDGGVVLSFKEKPDYEKPTDRNRDNVYEVTVRASDGAMHTDHMVMVTVTGADEPPTIMGKDDAISYQENGKDPVATFTAEDPEGVTPITWTLAQDTNIEGVVQADIDDKDLFEIDMKDGMLKFISPPDYEATEDGGGDMNNDNTYHVVVLAADATGNPGYHKVTVKVTNVAETGKVTWTVDHNGDGADTPTLMQFQVGATLTASATDGDIPGTGAAAKAVDATTNNLRWRWYRGGALNSDVEIASYTVTSSDIGKRLRVEVFYTVGGEREESASLTSDYPVLASRSSNDPPEFSPAAVTREVSEGKNGMAVGAPVRATDDITNALNYTLAGADEGRFKIDQKTGQITTNVNLDYNSAEGAADNCTALNRCVVEVTATDSAGAVSSPVATVTIKITDVNEKPHEFNGPKTIMSPENRKDLFGTDSEFTAATDVHLRGD